MNHAFMDCSPSFCGWVAIIEAAIQAPKQNDSVIRVIVIARNSQNCPIASKQLRAFANDEPDQVAFSESIRPSNFVIDPCSGGALIHTTNLAMVITPFHRKLRQSWSSETLGEEFHKETREQRRINFLLRKIFKNRVLLSDVALSKNEMKVFHMCP